MKKYFSKKLLTSFLNGVTLLRNNTKTKPLKRRLNRYVHLQRAGEAENPAERSTDKWIAEGEVNGQTPSIRNVCLRYKAENVLAFLLKWIDFQSIKVVPQELYLSFHRTGFLFLYDLTPFIRVISEKWMVDQPHRILNLYDRKEQINC